MLDLLRSAAAFIVVLGVLVFVHEFGHYIAARWRGVHVAIAGPKPMEKTST